MGEGGEENQTNRKPTTFSMVLKNSQCCDTKIGESISVSGDALRMQRSTLPAVTESKPSWLSQVSQPACARQAAAVLL